MVSSVSSIGIKWSILTSQLKIEMCRLGIQWEFVESKDKSAFGLIDYVILDNSISEYQFRAKIMSVINAAILVNELVNNALTQAENAKLTPDKGDSQT